MQTIWITCRRAQLRTLHCSNACEPAVWQQSWQMSGGRRQEGRTLRPWGHSGVLKVSTQAIMPTSFWPQGRLTGIMGLGAWWVPPAGITSSSTSTSRPARGWSSLSGSKSAIGVR